MPRIAASMPLVLLLLAVFAVAVAGCTGWSWD
jgi:hypothetical protein